jgi:hypothetical protein
MPRKPYPHEHLVRGIREEITSQSFACMSDDYDMSMVEKAGYSPMLWQGECNRQHRERARELGERLVEIGEPAAEAVAKGLRMQGGWRENLLPFAERFKDLPAVREALALVSKRERDPLSPRVCALLGVPCESPLANGGWRERRRRMRKWFR